MGNAPLAFSVSCLLILHVKNSYWGLASPFVQELDAWQSSSSRASPEIWSSVALGSLFSAALPLPSPARAGNLRGISKKGIFQTE